MASLFRDTLPCHPSTPIRPSKMLLSPIQQKKPERGALDRSARVPNFRRGCVAFLTFVGLRCVPHFCETREIRTRAFEKTTIFCFAHACASNLVPAILLLWSLNHTQTMASLFRDTLPCHPSPPIRPSKMLLSYPAHRCSLATWHGGKLRGGGVGEQDIL